MYTCVRAVTAAGCDSAHGEHHYVNEDAAASRRAGFLPTFSAALRGDDVVEISSSHFAFGFFICGDSLVRIVPCVGELYGIYGHGRFRRDKSFLGVFYDLSVYI